MERIALIKPPATYADWYHRPVLGISYIAASVEQRGHECRVFDAYYHHWSLQELVNRVVEYEPDIVGITAMTHEIVRASDVAGRIKQRLGATVVVGGCHCTALPARTLEEFSAFDCGVFGEGEDTFLELIDALRSGRHKANLGAVKGLVFRDGERVVVNEPRPYLTEEELNRLPYPAFHHYYGQDANALRQRDAWYVMFSCRGCPYRCAFCAGALGRKVRRRSVDNILGEIEHAVTFFGAHQIDFADEIFLFNDDRTREVLSAMVNTGLSRRIRWSALTRANIVDEEIVALAKRAGCIRLDMGVESGDEAILKAIGKAITLEQVRSAVHVIKKVGIPLRTYYILGHPYETPASAARTVDLAVELNTYAIAVGIMVPYPGTRVYQMAKRGEGGYRLLSECWSDYDKYGGRALELQHLRYEDMEKLQRSAYLKLYLRNLRLLDLMRFLWVRRKAVVHLLKKRLLRSRWTASSAGKGPDTSRLPSSERRSGAESETHTATEVRAYDGGRNRGQGRDERLPIDRSAGE